MIVTEFYKEREDGVILDITYSDSGYYIIQNGTDIKYAEAIDPRDCHRTYTESEELIPKEEIEVSTDSVEQKDN